MFGKIVDRGVRYTYDPRKFLDKRSVSRLNAKWCFYFSGKLIPTLLSWMYFSMVSSNNLDTHASLYRADSVGYVSQQNKDNSQIKILKIWNLTYISHVFGLIWRQCNRWVLFLSLNILSRFQHRGITLHTVEVFENCQTNLPKITWVEEIYF